MSQPALTRPEAAASASKDPLLQPFKLRHLHLKNRVISTCHEPAYSEDGFPKERYRLYHVEKAKGGCAMTMIGGSAVVSLDSPQASAICAPAPTQSFPGSDSSPMRCTHMTAP